MMKQGNSHKRYYSKNVSRFVFTMMLFLAGTLFGSQLFAQNYTLTVTSVPVTGGSVTRTPSTGTYPAGSLVQIQATPAAGWIFDSWSDDLTGSVNPTTISMDSAITITATFTQLSYTLTLSESGLGTTTKTPDLPSYLSGSNVSVQAYPTTGWTFTGWSGSPITDSNPSIVNMNENKFITANFSLKQYELTVEPDATPGASVTPSAPVMVDHGDAQVIIASVPLGYDFNEWTVTTGTGATILNKDLATTTITLTSGDVTVTASYLPKQYELTLITDGTDGATVFPSTTVLVTHGEAYVISADTIPDGYKLSKWTVFIGDATIANDTMEITTATLTAGNTIIQASFELKQYALTLVHDGTPGAAVSPTSTVLVTHGAPRLISSSTTDPGYEFDQWIPVSGTVNLGNDTLAITTVTLTTDNVILQATFKPKQYTLSLITDGTPGATVLPSIPVQVVHGVPRAISANTIPIGYKFSNWTNSIGVAVFGNDTMAATTATLTLGNATVQANFQKVLQITNVMIDNVTMNLGDPVIATINVSNDGGSPYYLVSGSIGGYPLVNLQRLNATTYRASFTITPGGNSYSALANIPVTNLIISDGFIQSIPYNTPIVQNNDAIDAKLPVVNTMTVTSNFYKVGDIVTLNINADSTHYTAHPITTINGTAVSAPNVQFVEVGNGNYRLIYTVLEGDFDVLAGQLAVSLILVKPSGNFNLIPFSIIQPNTLRIDANSPVTARMEVSQTEVGVGQRVQLVITADGLGYSGGPGTVINGVPITSARVSMVEQAGGLYSLNYLIAETDNNVLPGTLAATVVMTDSAGNNSIPYSVIVANALEIYTEVPVAAPAAPPQICQGEPAELTVYLSGRAPWRFDLSDGTSVTSYNLINESPYKIPFTLEETTTFEIDSVWDKNGVVNTGAGPAQVIVNEITNVQIMNLAPGYSLEADPFQLIAEPTGGRFSGPGVVSTTGYFYPKLAGTENSPHTLYYTLVNQHNCTSVDSALVFVLSAEGDIYIPDTAFCTNSDPFVVTASNLVGATGSFSLTDMNNKPAAGLTDNGNNTALVQPALMLEGRYVIVYEYFNGVPLFLRDTFSVHSIEVPTILNLNNEYCQNEDSVMLESSVDSALFSGPGVVGNITDGFLFYPNLAEAGTITIECLATSSNGCTALAQKEVTIKFAPVIGFELSTACIDSDGGVVAFENTSGNKLLVETWEWDFGDPASGTDNQSDLINPTHFYAEPDQRSISLTATTFEGCVITQLVDTAFGNVPVADFTLKTDCYGIGAGTTFYDKSTSEYSPLVGTKWIFKDSDSLYLGDIVSDTPLDSVTFLFGQKGDYIVDLIVESALGCTDTANMEITLKETFTPPADGYSEGFNTNQGLWTVQSEDQVASWIWDVPDFDDFVPDPADKAWYTDLPEGVVGYVENSWVQSPCFDLSAMKRPLFQMDLMKSFSSGNGVVFQYMDVHEEGWKTIGANTPGIEWYNADDIQNKPGGSSDGWGWDIFNPDYDWVTAAHDMDELAGAPYVSFRIAFATDESDGTGNQGFAFDNVIISERSKLVVLEHFTNSSDAASAAADEVVDAFGAAYLSDAIDIQYHTDYPGMGIDPMNQNYPDVSNYYFISGVPTVPYARLDGGISEELRFDFSDLKSTPSVDIMKQLTLQVPTFDVDLEVIWMDDMLEATTSVTCNVDLYAENIDLYVVVFESSVNAYTGINGDTTFRNVVLDMLPLPTGKLLGDNWLKGNNDTRINTWIYKPYVEDVEDLGVVAFVKDRGTKQILQAAVDFKTPQVGIGRNPVQMEALHIYPNPARSVVNVNIGSSSERDGKFEVIDMNGRIVQSEHVPSGYQIYQMDVQSLNRGFYMIQWYEGGVLKGRNKLVKVN